jgi:hypothetical protein
MKNILKKEKKTMVSFIRNIYDCLVESDIDISFEEVQTTVNLLENNVLTELKTALENGDQNTIADIMLN